MFLNCIATLSTKNKKGNKFLITTYTKNNIFLQVEWFLQLTLNNSAEKNRIEAKVIMVCRRELWLKCTGSGQPWSCSLEISEHPCDAKYLCRTPENV